MQKPTENVPNHRPKRCSFPKPCCSMPSRRPTKTLPAASIKGALQCAGRQIWAETWFLGCFSMVCSPGFFNVVFVSCFFPLGFLRRDDFALFCYWHTAQNYLQHFGRKFPMLRTLENTLGPMCLIRKNLKHQKRNKTNTDTLKKPFSF